jgi:hypothetical protein
MNFLKDSLLLFFFILYNSVFAQVETVEKISLEQSLETLFPDAEIIKTEPKDHFKEAFTLILNEPLDHNDPEAGTFKHYIYLSHAGFEKPSVLVTEGYNAWPRTYELSKIFEGNQVQVEYRFYGKSRPDPIPWQYLKNDQAIEDYHQLVTKLKKLYTGKWISTGISKGGETVLIYRYKYPGDMDMEVPYVAPLINGQEDPRTVEHYNTVGTDACRTKILRFQRHVLDKREAVQYEIKNYAKKKKMEFTIVPVEEAIEYAVMEFPFSFWQWGGKCDEIPRDQATGKEMFDYLNKIVGIGFYSDKTYYDLLPSYYQHMTELGYYGFDTTPVKDMLRYAKNPTNKRFAPKDVDLTYNPEYIKEVRNYVENKGDRILYIYGGYDTWGACAPNPKPDVDAVKMVLKGGSHKTRIKDFGAADRQLIYSTIQRWLGEDVEIHPLKN